MSSTVAQVSMASCRSMADLFLEVLEIYKEYYREEIQMAAKGKKLPKLGGPTLRFTLSGSSAQIAQEQTLKLIEQKDAEILKWKNRYDDLSKVNNQMRHQFLKQVEMMNSGQEAPRSMKAGGSHRNTFGV